MKRFASILFLLMCASLPLSAQFAGWGTYDSTNSPLPSSMVTTVTVDAENVVWAGTSKGLASFRELLQWDVYTMANSNLPDNHIQRIKTDAAGNVWLGTLNGSLARHNGGGSFTVFNSGNSPLGAYCVTDFVFEGTTIWVSTEGGGIFRYDGSNWTNYSSINLGLPIDVALSAAIDGQNRKYFGTANDGVFRLSGNTWSRIYTLNTNLPYDNVSAITVENDTTVWLGIGQQVSDSCLNRYNGSQVSIFDSTAASGFVMRNIRHIYVNGTTKWIASNNDDDGGLFIYNDTLFRVFREFSSGLASNRVYQSVMDDSSNLWIATFRGLSVFNENNLYLSEGEPEPASLFVKAWPNPALEELQFELPESGSYTFDMFNATGSTLSSQRLQAEGTVVLDIRHLQPGIYFVRFSGDEQRYLLRFVKI